jgi:hypothetical protein
MAARAKRTKTTAKKAKPAAPEPRDMHGRFNDQAAFLFKRAISKMGAPRIYDDPAELAKDVQEYFDWAKDNPLVAHRNPAEEKPRPLTLDSLCLYTGIEGRTWRKWRSERPDLIPVIEWAEKNIRDQKFGGAAINQFNANIISRDLGLVDRQDVTSDDKPVTEPLSDREVAMRIAFMLAKGMKSEENGDV